MIIQPNKHARAPRTIKSTVLITSASLMLASIFAAPIATAGTRQIATCQEIKLRCLAHAEKATALAQGRNASQAGPAASSLSAGKCLDVFNVAINTGVWPGRHDAPGAHCQP